MGALQQTKLKQTNYSLNSISFASQFSPYRRGEKLLNLGATILPSIRPTSASSIANLIFPKGTTERTTTSTTRSATRSTPATYIPQSMPLKITTERMATLATHPTSDPQFLPLKPTTGRTTTSSNRSTTRSTPVTTERTTASVTRPTPVPSIPQSIPLNTTTERRPERTTPSTNRSSTRPTPATHVPHVATPLVIIERPTTSTTAKTTTIHLFWSEWSPTKATTESPAWHKDMLSIFDISDDDVNDRKNSSRNQHNVAPSKELAANEMLEFNWIGEDGGGTGDGSLLGTGER